MYSLVLKMTKVNFCLAPDIGERNLFTLGFTLLWLRVIFSWSFSHFCKDKVNSICMC